ncbi:MAG: uncharacterized protein PWQ57_3449 [Desulfovibrionales bacterium]|nr:uncharacterized protein [Desulfovibrionales bacterium]
MKKIFSALARCGRRLLRFLGGWRLHISGACRRCGSCCRGIYLVEHGRVLKSVKQFEECLEENPEFERLRITDQDEDGALLFSCDWLTPQGTCKDYKNRLDLCRKFPSPAMQRRGYTLPKECGYRFVYAKPFERALRKALREERRRRKDDLDGESGEA